MEAGQGAAEDAGEGRVADMGRLGVTLVVALLLVLLGGALFLSLWNPPAPSRPVEKVLPNARFAR
jgi:hypothetical protein